MLHVLCGDKHGIVIVTLQYLRQCSTYLHVGENVTTFSLFT